MPHGHCAEVQVTVAAQVAVNLLCQDPFYTRMTKTTAVADPVVVAISFTQVSQVPVFTIYKYSVEQKLDYNNADFITVV